MAPWEEYAKAKPAAAAPAAEEGPWAQYAPKAKASTGPDYAGDVQRFRGKDQSARDQGSIGNKIAEFGAGAWHGAKAPIRGAQQLYNYVTGDTGRLNELQQEEEKAYNALTGAGKAGNVFGQVATAFIPVAGQVGKGLQAANVGTKALSAASKASPILKASATGAGVAALDPTMSEQGKNKDYLTEKAKDVAMGAGFGAAGQQLGRLFSGASEGVKRASQDLGGMATPGQLLAGKGGMWETVGDLERRAGHYLPGSGILSSRDKAHDAAVRGMLAKEAEKAGVDVKGMKDFTGMFQKVQEGKKAGYQDVVPRLSTGPRAEFGNMLNDSISRNVQGLNPTVAEDIISALNPLKPKTGAVHAENLQDTLSTLNKEISSRFAQNATRADNVAGERLVKIRDDIMAQAQKYTSPEDWKRFGDLNRLHQMTGADVQTKKGVFGKAAHYAGARERGTPTLREVGNAAAAGRQTVAKNEIAEEAARIQRVAGKHSTHDQGELAKLFTVLKGLPATSATFGASVVLPRTVYNPATIKLINKLASEGHPGAQKVLTMMGKGSAGVARTPEENEHGSTK